MSKATVGAAARAVLAAGLACAAAAASGCATPAPQAAATAAGRCAEERFPIYFTRGSAVLLPDSLTVVRAVAHRVAGCPISGVDVTGVAAPDAAAATSDPQLTQRRADAVAQALAQAGLPAPAFDVQTAGSVAPPAGVRTPLPRRTEVVVHAHPAG